jgi:hypothetical protein
MKLAIIISALAIFLSSAHADQRTQRYDRDGNNAGSTVTQDNGTKLFYDAKGTLTGKWVPQSEGVAHLYNARGDLVSYRA